MLVLRQSSERVCHHLNNYVEFLWASAYIPEQSVSEARSMSLQQSQQLMAIHSKIPARLRLLNSFLYRNWPMRKT